MVANWTDCCDLSWLNVCHLTVMLVAMVTLSGAFLGVVAAIAITALVFFLVGCDNNSNLASDIFQPAYRLDIRQKPVVGGGEGAYLAAYRFTLVTHGLIQRSSHGFVVRSQMRIVPLISPIAKRWGVTNANAAMPLGCACCISLRGLIRYFLHSSLSSNGHCRSWR